MKLKVETFIRGYVLTMVFLLAWALWASAQTGGTNAAGTNTNTNTVATTSTNAPSLGDNSMLPIPDQYLTFGLDRIEVLRMFHPFGEPLWKYLASLIYIFLAFYISKLLDHLIGVWLKQLASRTASKFDDHLLNLMHGPVKIVAFVIFLHIGLKVFTWPQWLEDTFSKALKFVVACSLTYMALKFVDLLTGYWKDRLATGEDRAFDEQLIPILRKSIKAFIIVVAVLIFLPAVGINITGLIASLSIGGLAIGLAAQDTLSNLFGAVAIFLDKPFRVGDRIQLDAIDGTVETIGLRSTRVRNADGHLITVPNKTMGNATITNVARRPNIRTLMNIGLTYDTPAGRVRRAAEILREVYRRHPKTQDVWISFNKFGDFALNVQVVHWWGDTDYQGYLAGMQELNLEIKERFDAEGLAFAFPTQTLHLRQDGPTPAAPPAPLPNAP
jgi:MscS family membrane protein